MSSIGQRIKEFRNKTGVTQTQLGELMGCGKSFISAIENDKSKPTIEHLVNLLVNYGLNINYILAGIGDMFVAQQYGAVKSELRQEVLQILKEEGII